MRGADRPLTSPPTHGWRGNGAWILTSLQVVALWAAGRDRWWAWLLGCGVQPVWIVYALVTDQIGFVPECLISAFVQVRNFLIKEAARTAVVNSQPAQQ